MTITLDTWADYLRHHPEAELYNENAESIAALHDHTKDPIETFTKISESPTLVVLSGNPVEDGFQSVFNLFSTGSNLLKKSKKFNALMGFGKKAIPVRVDPKSLFKFSSTTRQVPDFKDLVMVESVDDIKNLKKGKTKMRIPNHAILPPEFSEILLDHTELEAEDLLALVANKIRSIIIKKEVGVVDEKEELEDQDTLEEASKDEEVEDEDNKEGRDPFKEDLSKYEASYQDMLIFLWAMIQEKSVVPGTPLNPALDEATIQQANIIHKNVFGDYKKESSEEEKDTTGLHAILSEFGSRIDHNTAMSQAKASLGEKEDNKKDWLKLTLLSRNVMEGMQVKDNPDIEGDDDEDVIFPSGPN